MIDGDNYTWEGPTLPQRVEIAQAHMAQDLATVDLTTFTQRTTAILASFESRLFRVEQALLNREDTPVYAPTLFDPQDGI